MYGAFVDYTSTSQRIAFGIIYLYPQLKEDLHVKVVFKHVKVVRKHVKVVFKYAHFARRRNLMLFPSPRILFCLLFANLLYYFYLLFYFVYYSLTIDELDGI